MFDVFSRELFAPVGVREILLRGQQAAAPTQLEEEMSKEQPSSFMDA